ncbi:carbohydrate sulfotransferase 1 [Ciona intestinalis]
MFTQQKRCGSGLIFVNTRQSNVGLVIKVMTTRSVCLTFIVSLCCFSFMLSVFHVFYHGTTQTIAFKRTVNPNLPKHPSYREKHLDVNVEDPVLRITRNDVIRKQGFAVSKKLSKLYQETHRDYDNPTSRFDLATKPKTQIRKNNPAYESHQNVFLPLQTTESANLNSTVETQHVDVAQDSMSRTLLIRNVTKYYSRIKQSVIRSKYYSEKIKLLPEQTKGVVLLTNYRSGSTFLGQLFNQHPDVFYQFEPLYPFTGGCGYQTSVKVALLKRLLKCDIPHATDTLSKVTSRFRKSTVDMECLIDDFCFRKKTQELCTRHLCPFGQPDRCYGCGPLHLPRVMNVCRAKKMSAIKVIRLCDVTALKSLLEDPALDFKIVHLVRDPRGIASSRLKINKDWNKVSYELNQTCDRLLSNIAAGDSITLGTKWLRGRYMKVKYEDLSLEPIRTTKQIYNFTGLKYLPSVERWINANTRASKSKRDPYSTARDSAYTMEAWRNFLTIEQVLSIQKDCSQVMNKIGYKTVVNESELTNLNVKLVR